MHRRDVRMQCTRTVCAGFIPIDSSPSTRTARRRGGLYLIGEHCCVHEVRWAVKPQPSLCQGDWSVVHVTRMD